MRKHILRKSNFDSGTGTLSLSAGEHKEAYSYVE